MILEQENEVLWKGKNYLEFATNVQKITLRKFRRNSQNSTTRQNLP